MPLASERVWSAFWEMDQCRRGNGYAALPINHQDLAGFQACAGFRFRPWERRAILAMDRKRLAWLNKRDEDGAPAGDAPELTPEMFDALFG